MLWYLKQNKKLKFFHSCQENIFITHTKWTDSWNLHKIKRFNCSVCPFNSIITLIYCWRKWMSHEGMRLKRNVFVCHYIMILTQQHCEWLKLLMHRSAVLFCVSWNASTVLIRTHFQHQPKLCSFFENLHDNKRIKKVSWVSRSFGSANMKSTFRWTVKTEITHKNHSLICNRFGAVFFVDNKISYKKLFDVKRWWDHSYNI